MKARRVILTVELETNVSIKELKNGIRDFFSAPVADEQTDVIQIQANVIKKEN